MGKGDTKLLVRSGITEEGRKRRGIKMFEKTVSLILRTSPHPVFAYSRQKQMEKTQEGLSHK